MEENQGTLILGIGSVIAGIGWIGAYWFGNWPVYVLLLGAVKLAGGILILWLRQREMRSR